MHPNNAACIFVGNAIAEEQRTYVLLRGSECVEARPIATQELKNAVVYYLVRNDVTGGKNVTVDTVKNRAAVPTHAQGETEEAIRELIRTPPPVQAYGGQRDAIQLTSLPDGVEYLKNHGGDVPFGWE